MRRRVFPISTRLDPKGSKEGIPVPIETIHLIFISSGSSDQKYFASFHSSRTGLFAPVAPSINSSPNSPIFIGSKKDDAADVARAASQIFVVRSKSEEPRET